MAIFCPSCGTLYGGWEFCPECNADNPYLDRREDPVTSEDEEWKVIAYDRLGYPIEKRGTGYGAQWRCHRLTADEVLGKGFDENSTMQTEDKREDPAHKPVEHHDSGAGENSGEDGANVPTILGSPLFF